MKLIKLVLILFTTLITTLSLNAQVPLEVEGPDPGTSDIVDLTSQSTTTRMNFNSKAYLLSGSNKRAFIETDDTWLRFSPSNNNTGGGITFAYNNSGTPLDRMVLNSAGNVGIGTLSPDQLLSVVGGKLRVNNYILPEFDGNSGDIITTDGSGNLSWSAPSTGQSEVSFFAELSSNLDPMSNSFSPIVFLSGFSEDFDNGGAFDAATGTFTAPVAGTYHFTFRPSSTPNSSGGFINGRMIARIYKNGSIVDERQIKEDWDNGWFTQIKQTVLLDLNAGDQIKVTALCICANAPELVGANINHSGTNFSGYLIK